MKIEAALVKEQGTRFAVVSVKPYVLSNPSESGKMIRSLGSVFHGYEVVLMAKQSGDRVSYRGRLDIVKFLGRVSPLQLPWAEYTVSG